MENNGYKQDRDRFTPPVDVTKKKRTSFRLPAFFTKKPTKKHLLMVSGVAVGVLALGAGGLALFGPEAPAPNPEPQVTSNYVPPEPTTTASALTGVEVDLETAKRPVTGVMIENSIDARPQAGLVDAGVVFEAIAEGGITRFLALFQESQPESIGPIRSARPYYVQWAAGFDAAYVHSGGSGEAIALIQKLGVKDLDHANNPNFFDRVNNRYAPHNVYTTMARLDELKNSKGFTSSEFTGFTRVKKADDDKKQADTPAPTEPTDATTEVPAETAPANAATNLAFNISGPLYNTTYAYDATTKTYQRSMANQPHTDERSGKQITPKVVVALITSYSVHPNGVHSVYGVVGTGKALVFQNGVVTEGIWKKESDKGPLLFETLSAQPLELEAGQTWITAIPDGRVTYTP
jgi:hypothetical protein